MPGSLSVLGAGDRSPVRGEGRPRFAQDTLTVVLGLLVIAKWEAVNAAFLSEAGVSLKIAGAACPWKSN